MYCGTVFINVDVGFSSCLVLFIQGELSSISIKQNIFTNKHKLLLVYLTWLPQVSRKMLILVNKHPSVLVFVCLIVFFIRHTNYI